MNPDAVAQLVAGVLPGAVINETERLTGGVSADVYRLDLTLPDGNTRSIVLRSHGESHSGHEASLEYDLLKWLHASGLPVPEPLHVDTSGQILPDPCLLIDFSAGSSALPEPIPDDQVNTIAAMLARIHGTPVTGLPEALPQRRDPLLEVFDFLPTGAGWQDITDHLHQLRDTGFTGQDTLLHGDFWPENLLWVDGDIRAVLDWEDAALGDPLSDVACTRVELRYRYGPGIMRIFTHAYEQYRPVDRQRLALWQIYVAAAAQRYMGSWGLPAEQEAHMRREALASIREAGDALLKGAVFD